MINMVMSVEPGDPNSLDDGEITAEEDIFYDVEDAYAEGEALVRAGGWLTAEPDTCIQDQGASSFLIGTEYALRYFKWLEMIGYPMNNLIFKRCNKSFKFGGDATCKMDGIELPVRIADHPGRIQAYIIYGATPMLFGRPLLEALQAEVNFGASKMRLLHQEWQDIPRGRQGAMLLRLAANVSDPQAFESPVFDFRCEDDHPEETDLSKFLDDLNAHERYFEMTTEVKTFFTSEPNLIPEETFMEADDHDDQAPLQPGETVKTIEQLQKTMSWIEAQLQEKKHVQQEILHARDQGQHRRRMLIWEVYVGGARSRVSCRLMVMWR